MNIVVGYHATPEGAAAFERAVQISTRERALLHLVSVVALPRQGEDPGQYEEARSAEEDELRQVSATVEGRGVRCEIHVPAVARNAADAILTVAEAVTADLIVIGMRRRSRVGKLVLGSTAQVILLQSDADVLSVKATEE